MTGGEQLTFADMPTRLFACTPSRLATFDCPRRYRFAYVDRPPPPRGAPWAHNTVGAIAHLALYRWWLLPRSQRTPDEGAALVERNWQSSGFRDDRQSQQACITTAEWVRRYLERLDPRAEPVGVERTVSTVTAGLAVSGRVDRIDDRYADRSAELRDGDPDLHGPADEVVIVDYKTGRRAPTEADAARSSALALYVLAARRTLRRGCRRVELHHLPTGDVAAFDHTDDTLRAHLDRAEATAVAIGRATDALAAGADPDTAFPPVPSTSCSWCDFRSLCPEGRAVSPTQPSWAGLASD